MRYPVVYFVQSVIGGPIKIGKSVDPMARLIQLQSGSPFQLRLLATTAKDIELELHERFAADRLHGEWFHPSQELRDYIVDAQKKERFRNALRAHVHAVFGDVPDPSPEP